MRMRALVLPVLAWGCGDKAPSSRREDVVVIVDTGPADADGDGFDETEDCDDADPSAYPGGVEDCDGVDNDCDGLVDEDAVAWYGDTDGDGYGDDGDSVAACAQPSGYVSAGGDCDDDDAAVSPGAAEVCNGVDDDCDGTVDGAGAADASTWYADSDGDGFGDPGAATVACEAPSGSVAGATDCDDTDAAVSPDGVEACNGADDDCDGDVDEDDAVDAGTWYRDADGDGFGDASDAAVACAAPSGYGGDATDCDDTEPGAYPGADETCDGIDNDCEGDVDEADAVDAGTWYADTDGDGFGDPAAATVACDMPAGTVADDTDCDDADAGIKPGATEYCDGVDNDCDGIIDEAAAADARTWYRDGDGDGYGDAATALVGCAAPSGYGADATDCDDAEAAHNPGADEVCDGDDDDCDGAIDEDDAVDAAVYYADADGDGFGDDATEARSCSPPSGSVSDGGDCDDGAADVYPGATEICRDGVVQDCDRSEEEAFDACDDWGTTVRAGAADAEFTGTATEWFFGIHPAPVGDVDGDGVPDVLLGASFGSPGGATQAGSTHLFYGPVSGTLPMSTADVIVAGRRTYDEAASSGSGLGDLDGDGYADILIGGPGSDETVSGGGAVWLLHGPVTTSTVTDYDLRVTGQVRYGQLGAARAAVGDQDGDGVGDFIVGAAFSGTYEGAAFVISGAETGRQGASSVALAQIDGDAATDFLGRRVGGGEDLDGDGVDDVVVGCQDCGSASSSRAYVFLGPVTGGVMATSDADTTVASSADDDLSSGLSLGDLNADGQADLVLGAPNSTQAGRARAGGAYVFHGPLASGTLLSAAADGLVRGTATNDRVGGSVDVAADIDGDGTGDLLLASGFLNVTTSAIGYADGTGEAWAVYGPVTGTVDVDDADHRFVGLDPWFGTGGITSVGDMNLDGRDDVLIVSGYTAKSAYLFYAPGY